MRRTVLALIVVLAGTAPAAFLGGNPRLGESLLNTSIEQVAGELSRELLPGWGGAWLRGAAEFFVAPSAARALGDIPSAARQLVAQAERQYPKLAGRVQWHHTWPFEFGPPPDVYWRFWAREVRSLPPTIKS
jgi:hypothetical protein